MVLGQLDRRIFVVYPPCRLGIWVVVRIWFVISVHHRLRELFWVLLLLQHHVEHILLGGD